MYRAELARIRRTRLFLNLVWIGYMPGMFLFAREAESRGVDSQTAVLVAFGGLVVATTAVRWRLNRLRCPRCSKPFLGRPGFYYAMTNNCMHCGLSIR